jgi:hypothetical protein
MLSPPCEPGPKINYHRSTRRPILATYRHLLTRPSAFRTGHIPSRLAQSAPGRTSLRKSLCGWALTRQLVCRSGWTTLRRHRPSAFGSIRTGGAQLVRQARVLRPSRLALTDPASPLRTRSFIGRSRAIGCGLLCGGSASMHRPRDDGSTERSPHSRMHSTLTCWPSTGYQGPRAPAFSRFVAIVQFNGPGGAAVNAVLGRSGGHRFVTTIWTYIS